MFVYCLAPPGLAAARDYADNGIAFVNILFGNGLKIMTAARNAVNKPITSSHFVASMYGRECGKGTLSFCSEQ